MECPEREFALIMALRALSDETRVGILDIAQALVGTCLEEDDVDSIRYWDRRI